MDLATSKNIDQKYFPALTGLRAIAAYMVFFHHVNPLDGVPHLEMLSSFVSEFHVGVTFFFVLSGFLICHRYFEVKEINFRAFILNRFARIYPIYFLLTTALFLLNILYLKRFQFNLNLTEYFLNISFLKGFFDEFKFSGISQGWSLTVEEMFYFLAPVIFYFIKKHRINIIVLPIFIVLVGMLLVMIFSKISFYGFFSNFTFLFSYTFLGRAFEFFIGIALAIFYKKNYLKKTRFSVTYIALIGIGMMVLMLSFLKQEGYYYGVQHPAGMLINNLFLPLIGIAPLYWGLLTENTMLKRILSSKLFLILGKSSYVFYLIHVGFVLSILTKISGNLFFLFFTLNFISFLLFKFIEEPLNFYIKNKFH